MTDLPDFDPIVVRRDKDIVLRFDSPQEARAWEWWYDGSGEQYWAQEREHWWTEVTGEALYQAMLHAKFENQQGENNDSEE